MRNLFAADESVSALILGLVMDFVRLPRNAKPKRIRPTARPTKAQPAEVQPILAQQLEATPTQAELARKIYPSATHNL